MSNYSTNQNRIPMYSQTGRVVGWMQNNILQKNAIASKHMLQVPRGWAWDKSTLDQAERDGCTKTVIYDKENNQIYTANLTDYWHLGVRINRGFGEQICLPIMYWTVTEFGKSSAHQLVLAI